MSRIYLFIIIGFLLSGCGSHLKFSTEKYDLDACRKMGYGNQSLDIKCDASKEYFKQHPYGMSLAEQQLRLKLFKDALPKHEKYLQDLNSTVSILFFGYSSSDGKRDISKHDATISKETKDLSDSVSKALDLTNSAIKQVGYNTSDLNYIKPLIDDYRLFKSNLIANNIVIDAKSVKDVIQQVERLGNNILKQRADEARNKIPREQLSILNIIEEKEFDQIDRATTPVVSQLEKLEGPSGDLVSRKYYVFQDLSDPFWGYIATHEENWQTLPNRANVEETFGSDSEYIFVLENTLDGRWKKITVDPSKIVKARLRITRKVAAAVTSIIGVAAKAYGVPVPTNILGQQEKAEIDISQMTAEEQWTKMENQKIKAALNDIQAYAQGTLSKLNAKGAKEKDAEAKLVLDQLIRKLSRVVPDNK